MKITTRSLSLLVCAGLFVACTDDNKPDKAAISDPGIADPSASSKSDPKATDPSKTPPPGHGTPTTGLYAGCRGTSPREGVVLYDCSEGSMVVAIIDDPKAADEKAALQSAVSGFLTDNLEKLKSSPAEPTVAGKKRQAIKVVGEGGKASVFVALGRVGEAQRVLSCAGPQDKCQPIFDDLSANGPPKDVAVETIRTQQGGRVVVAGKNVDIPTSCEVENNDQGGRVSCAEMELRWSGVGDASTFDEVLEKSVSSYRAQVATQGPGTVREGKTSCTVAGTKARCVALETDFGVAKNTVVFSVVELAKQGLFVSCAFKGTGANYPPLCAQVLALAQPE